MRDILLKAVNEKLPIQGLDCSGQNLREIDCTGAVFEKVNFKNTNLHMATLNGAVFQECDLTGANLSGARFEGAEFETCRLAPG